MLAIRMQRVGRKGHAQYRVVVQDSRFSPKSGRVVAYLGSYDPHAKTAILDKDKASTYLGNGAQPSDRVAQLMKAEGVKLPAWVEKSQKKQKAVKRPDHLRRNRPAEEKPAEAPAAEETAAAPEAEAQPAEPAEPTESPAEETPATDDQPAEEPAADAPAEPAAPVDEAQTDSPEPAPAEPDAKTE